MTKPNKTNNSIHSELPLVGHLIELRTRLVRAVIVILVFFGAMFPFANDIYTFVAEPLMRFLPQGSTMIATEVASPFLTPFKFTMYAALFASIPFILYQLWAFIAPGLYSDERELAMPLLISSVVLFYIGVAFSYFVVFPLVFEFFTSTTPTGVSMMTDISKYLDFVLGMFLAFGLAFEVPIATIILVLMGVFTPAQLVEKRPYVIVGAFIIGMILSPPDVISQTLLAVPMWILFEAGVIVSRMILSKKSISQRSEAASAKNKEKSASGATQAAPKTRKATAASPAATATAKADEPFRPLTPEEMDAELDRLTAEDKRALGDDKPPETA